MDALRAIDRALGRPGARPRPLSTGVATDARDAYLRTLLFVPEHPIPTEELAEWAFALSGLDKRVVVIAAVAAVEAAHVQRGRGADGEFVDAVLHAVRAWRDGPQTMDDLAELGELWWALVRNPPEVAQTPLGDAAFMAWWVAGYDPEGWLRPPEDPSELERWLRDAADHRTAIVDVLGLAQEAAGPSGAGAVLEAVRGAVADWRSRSA